MNEQRIRVQPLERLTALCAHPSELGLHGQLAHLRGWGAVGPRRVGLVLAPLRVEPPRARIAEIVT